MDHEKEHRTAVNDDAKANDQQETTVSLIQRARTLFRRVPILGHIGAEAFVFQCQSSLLNFMFVLATKEALPVDSERASFTANVSSRNTTSLVE